MPVPDNNHSEFPPSIYNLPLDWYNVIVLAVFVVWILSVGIAVVKRSGLHLCSPEVIPRPPLWGGGAGDTQFSPHS